MALFEPKQRAPAVGFNKTPLKPIQPRLYILFISLSASCFETIQKSQQISFKVQSPLQSPVPNLQFSAVPSPRSFANSSPKSEGRDPNPPRIDAPAFWTFITGNDSFEGLKASVLRRSLIKELHNRPAINSSAIRLNCNFSALLHCCVLYFLRRPSQRT